MNTTKLMLCGYHQVGEAVLEHVLNRDDIADVAVFTHLAAPNIPDLEAAAKQRNVWCSTESINHAKWPFEPDIIASVYYRTIIRSAVIERVNKQIFNLHPSLLPLYRGCSSVTWALANGEKHTGISFHYIDEGVDTGPLILQAALQIGSEETQASLYKRCMTVGAQYWPAAFRLVQHGFLGVPQQGVSSYYGRGAPFGGQIDDEWPTEQIERFIRAMTNPPYPYAHYRGLQVKTFAEYERARETAI